MLLRERAAKSQQRAGRGRSGGAGPRGNRGSGPRVDPATQNALAQLGLRPGATLGDARAAFDKVKREYHQAMRRSHPDVSDCHHSVAQKINEAYAAHRKAWRFLEKALSRS
jgi:hypothetical protein